MAKARSIFVVDIGNTSVTVGRASSGRIYSIQRLKSAELCDRKIRATLRKAMGRHAISGAALCSVVPRQTRNWSRAIKALAGMSPLVVTHKARLGIGIDYPDPGSIGPDRLANAVAAVDRLGAPVVVADFGTALTFDIVDPCGSYVGGIIAPGLPLMTDYLAERTALLPHIRLRGPHGAVGKSTVTAMRIGGQIGYRGMVREIVDHLTGVFGGRRPKLCATGGFAHWVLDGLDMPFIFEPKLTLHGLRKIYEINEEN